MENSFNLSNYKKTLEAGLKSGYKFLSFADKTKRNYQHVCLLRHDIDADLVAALKMAKVENELGIQSTYFFMTRSAVYNLFSRLNFKMLLEIKGLGHHIGLHFDAGFYNDNIVNLEQMIELEADYLGKQLSQDIEVVSFHQPSRAIINNEIKLKKYINTYDKDDMLGFSYISDSNMQWKSGHPYNFFMNKTYPQLQLLIHPMWWFFDEPAISTSVIWDRTLQRSISTIQQFLFETEGAYPIKGEIVIKY